MRLSLLCSTLVCTTTAIWGQEFEVVSIRPNNSITSHEFDGSDRGRFTASNIPLRALIARAYGMAEYQIVGTDWLSGRFDVVAKFPQDFDGSQAAVQAMLRKMLAERFELQVHRDTRTMRVRAVVVGKKGIKFKEAPAGCSASRNNRPGNFVGTCISMKSFAEFVSWNSDVPVIDLTGLTAVYDLTLHWVPERRQTAEGTDPAGPAAGPTLDIAIQEQLGLNLELRKAPVDILVVDRVERLPTEN